MGRKREPGPSGQVQGNTDRTHYQNFIDAIRANDPSILNGNVEQGHYSCSLIHLANTSYRLGRSLDFDPRTQRYVNDDEANKMLTPNVSDKLILCLNSSGSCHAERSEASGLRRRIEHHNRRDVR